MEATKRKLSIQETQCIQVEEDVLNNVGVLQVPETDDNEMDVILNDVDEKEVLLAKLGWVDNNDDELMDMTAIFLALGFE
eukprot:10429284-Ditylum_brightwellii.AAC.1